MCVNLDNDVNDSSLPSASLSHQPIPCHRLIYEYKTLKHKILTTETLFLGMYPSLDWLPVAGMIIFLIFCYIFDSDWQQKISFSSKNNFSLHNMLNARKC